MLFIAPRLCKETTCYTDFMTYLYNACESV